VLAATRERDRELPLASSYTPGSSEDFDRLYRASYARIVRTLVGVVGSQEAAEDCAQEAFARALGAWSRWQAQVPAEAWLHRIAINTAISFKRKETIRALPSLISRLGPLRLHADPPDTAAATTLVDELRRLPPRQAAAIVMRYYHGYTNREIAAAIGVSERTVGQRITDGMARLRKRIEA
jgi:RNA polymerase sigma factor (sigma-70 family)